MERGLLVELSPHEETTLLRIANRDDGPNDLREHDLSRLRLLGLVEAKRKGFGLTTLGKQRLARFANQ